MTLTVARARGPLATLSRVFLAILALLALLVGLSVPAWAGAGRIEAAAKATTASQHVDDQTNRQAAAHETAALLGIESSSGSSLLAAPDSRFASECSYGAGTPIYDPSVLRLDPRTILQVDEVGRPAAAVHMEGVVGNANPVGVRPGTALREGSVVVSGFLNAAKGAAELPEGYRSFSAAKRAMGSPGEGNVFDHVVEQSQIKRTRSAFAPDEIHNPFNMNPVRACR